MMSQQILGEGHHMADTFDGEPHGSDLLSALEDMNRMLGSTEVLHALAAHLNPTESMSLARVFWAAGYAETAHHLARAQLREDPECRGLLSPTEAGVQLRVYSPIDAAEPFYQRTLAGSLHDAQTALRVSIDPHHPADPRGVSVVVADSQL